MANTTGTSGNYEQRGVAASAAIRPWMITLMIFLAGQTLAAVWWAASINEKVKAMSQLEQQFSEVVSRVDTALAVLKDHGTELTDLRGQLSRQQGVDDAIRTELRAGISDRFSAADWCVSKRNLDERREADIKIYDLKMQALSRRIDAQEQKNEQRP